MMDFEQDVVEPENVPELVAKLVPGIPLTEGQWTYYMPRSRKWVYRMLTAVFKAGGGKFSGWSRRSGHKIGSGLVGHGTSGNRRRQLGINRRLLDRTKQPTLTEVMSA
jgi:hypothetical protein